MSLNKEKDAVKDVIKEDVKEVLKAPLGFRYVLEKIDDGDLEAERDELERGFSKLSPPSEKELLDLGRKHHPYFGMQESLNKLNKEINDLRRNNI